MREKRERDLYGIARLFRSRPDPGLRSAVCAVPLLTPTAMRRFVLLFALLSFTSAAHAQQDFSEVEIETTNLGGGVFMLTGAGGNIGLSVGDDGAFLIDDQFAPLSEKIKAAVAAQTDAPIRFVVNTHWHGDHTGGNEAFGESGAILVAHENVRERMSTEQFNAVFDRTTPASPDAALPVVTFTDAVTFHWNGDAVHVMHVTPAHTDGDAVIHFREANVIHAGDTFFNGRYPYIDTSSGGSLQGVIDVSERLLALADADTQIIPGHGPLGNRADLETYRDVLVTARDRVQARIEAGDSREAVVAARPMADYDATWGTGFMEPDVWIGIVYDSLTAE